MNNPTLTKVAGVCALLLATAPVLADQTADEVNATITSLAPMTQTQTVGDDETMTTRQIVVAPVEIVPVERVDVVVRDRIIAIDADRSIDREVYFAYDSAELTERARAALHVLGQALQSRELRPYRYLVAGHTDAAGSAAYNQALSERRARAVSAYLVRNFAIDPARLVYVGLGEASPKTPSQPYAGINRRVQVALITSEHISTE